MTAKALTAMNVVCVLLLLWSAIWHAHKQQQAQVVGPQCATVNMVEVMERYGEVYVAYSTPWHNDDHTRDWYVKFKTEQPKANMDLKITEYAPTMCEALDRVYNKVVDMPSLSAKPRAE
jgi:hypothetical protein